MRIILIYQYFLSDNEPGHTRWNEMTKMWADSGNQITVIAGMINYNTGKRNKKYKNKLFFKENYHNNVNVIRCHVSNSYNKNFLGRLWAYFSFVFFGLFAALFKTKGQHDAIVVSSPPLFVGIIGLFIKKIRKIPMIFEIRDLWPESAVETGVVKNKYIIKISYWLEKYIYDNSILLNVLTPAFKKHLVDKKDIPIDKIIYIPNAADFNLMKKYDNFNRNDFRADLGWDGKFVIIYVGAHGVANNLLQLLDAAKKLEGSKAHIVLIGDGMEKEYLIDYSKKNNLDNVEFLDPIPKIEVIKYILASDAGTSVLKKNDVFKTIYSNKTFDYMICKKPILMGIDGASRDLVSLAKAGFFVEPENPESFAINARKLMNNKKECIQMGQNGYDYAKQYFHREKLARKYLELINNRLDNK